MVKLAGTDGATGGTTRRVRAVHSERLMEILTSRRTAAMAAELMRRPDVALAALTHALVKSVFFSGECGERLARISLTVPVLAEEVRASAAAEALASKHAAFAALMRADHDERFLFDWLLAQQQDTLLELLTSCTTHALDTASSGEARLPAFLDIARALNLDMNNWWRPTAANYFQHVSKERIVDVVAQAVSTDVAAPMAKMKKSEAADAAEHALAPHRWLPDALRTS
jgi:ParB family chromosome partitioning protein